jgi:hypothetical protein
MSRKARRRRRDADRLERIEIHRAHFHVFDAALAQRVQRSLARADHALRADRAVELVLDLQQRRRQLPVFVARPDPDRLVRRIRLRQRIEQRRRVRLDAVVADRERVLRFGEIAEAAHPERRRVRQVPRTFAQVFEPVRTALDECRADSGRGAEQVQQQPPIPAEIADQREIAFVRIGQSGQRPRGLRQREVVVQSRDRLHPLAVAICQSGPVDELRAADIRSAITTDRDVLFQRQVARHARVPDYLAADVTIDELVQRLQLRKARLDAGMRIGHQFQLRFAEVRRDVRMRQRRAQRGRMRRRGERAVFADAQPFLLDAAAQPGEDGGRQCGEAILESGHGIIRIVDGGGLAGEPAGSGTVARQTHGLRG